MAKFNKFGPTKKPKAAKKETAPNVPEETADPVKVAEAASSLMNRLSDFKRTNDAIAFKKEMTPHLIEAATKIATSPDVPESANVKVEADHFLIDMFKLFGVKKETVPVPDPETADLKDVTMPPNRDDGEGQAAEGLVAE